MGRKRKNEGSSNDRRKECEECIDREMFLMSGGKIVNGMPLHSLGASYSDVMYYKSLARWACRCENNDGGDC